MREKFLDIFAVTTASGYGVSAAQVAGIATAAGAGSSRDLQGVDYSGMFGTNQQRFTAAQLGQTYGSFVAQNAQGNVLPGLQAKDAMIQQLVQSALSPSMKRWLDSEIEKQGGKGEVAGNTGKQSDIGLGLLNQGLDPGMVKAMANALMGPGTLDNVPENAIGEWVVRQYVGAGSLAAAAEKDEAAKNEQPIQGDNGNNPFLGILGGHGGSDFVSQNYGTNILSGAVRSKNSTLDAYDQLQKQTGKTDPAIESFIQATGHYSEIGVEVETKDGKKTVSKDDAIRYYGDQLASGKARIVGGPNDLDGKTVGEITGVTQKDFTPMAGRDNNTTDDPAAAGGVSADDWRKDHSGGSYDDTSTNTGGKYTVELSDSAKKLLTLIPPAAQNSQVEAGASAGLPPIFGVLGGS
jgi:hypothetical protein